MGFATARDSIGEGGSGDGEPDGDGAETAPFLEWEVLLSATGSVGEVSRTVHDELTKQWRMEVELRDGNKRRSTSIVKEIQ